MIAISLDKIPESAGFKDHGTDVAFSRATEPGIIDGAQVTAVEYRKEVDGSEMKRHEVSSEFFSLILPADRSSMVEEELNRTSTTYERMTITSQFDTYHGFRAMDFYEDNPGASFFRVHLSKTDAGRYWPQYYSREFLDFLVSNFDCGGVSFVEEDITDYVYMDHEG